MDRRQLTHAARALSLVTTMLLVAGCGGGGSSGGSTSPEVEEPKQWLGPDASIDDVLTAVELLSDEVDAAFIETGGNPTGFSDLPNSSDVTYTGPLVSYAADLTLVMDVTSGSIDGKVENVATTLDGFDHPSGTIDVAGRITNELGDAALDFIGSGPLSQGDHTAQYTLPEVFGYFGGSEGEAVAGYQATNFIWRSGPFAGSNSSSDGGFLAVTE